MESSLSPSSLPPPKKSRNRSKRWDQPAPGQERKVPSPARTSDNVNGERLLAQAIKEDPVLNASLNSFRGKKDIDEEIRTSSTTLGHGSKSTEEVFYRSTVAHQLKVITKANAYVEVIITDNCKYKVQGDRGTTAGSPRNFVQTYLSGLILQQVKDLNRDVQAAMDDVSDTNRLMNVYFAEGIVNVVIEWSFLRNLDYPKNPHFTAKGPYKPTDENRVLHQRLAIHNRHFIPIGFYYTKWLKKLRFHLNARGDDDGNSSFSSNSSGASRRSQKEKVKDKAASEHQRSSRRPKVKEDRAVTPSKRSSLPKTGYTRRRTIVPR
jgi:hypothetical protein